jgi:hypothetical protein
VLKKSAVPTPAREAIKQGVTLNSVIKASAVPTPARRAIQNGVELRAVMRKALNTPVRAAIREKPLLKSLKSDFDLMPLETRQAVAAASAVTQLAGSGVTTGEIARYVDRSHFIIHFLLPYEMKATHFICSESHPVTVFASMFAHSLALTVFVFYVRSLSSTHCVRFLFSLQIRG